MSITSTHSSAGLTRDETFADAGAVIAAPAFFGPPVGFLLGPWLLLVLLLAPPFAVLFTVVLVLAVAVGLLAALAALLASPYLLVRRHRAHRSLETKPQASPRPVRGQRVSSVRVGSPQAKGA